ncbi:MAG TPA: MarR family winged helix-turn-helix transcriptional regulator [Steroidobacteraceae bacterium]|nr:MarR family winged helix-turn-helix transcriptional regulator [Steroidobacteraceae bacterium]
MSSTREGSPPLPLIGALLRLAGQAMQQRLAGWIEASGYQDIQPAHSAVIQPLWQRPEGLRLTELARLSRITKQSMSALVSELESAGYVVRVPDADDARAMRIRLTARGRRYVGDVRAFARQIETEWAAQIGAQRVEHVREALHVLLTRVLAQDAG